MIALWSLSCALMGGREATAPPSVAVRPQAQDDLVYFVMVDRFYNGDPLNDAQIDLADPHAFHGGDLAGLIEKLPYLDALGVRTVWLSPVFSMQDEKFYEWGAFHGYWVRDLRTIEPRFGSEADLAQLGQALEDRGMRLVLDMVYNHSSFDSPLREQHPGWYHPDLPIEDWNDPAQLTQRTVHGLPDLDQQNPEVYAYLRDATSKWIVEAGVDGLRIDAVRHMSPEFLRQISGDMHTLFGPAIWVLGEDFQGDPNALSRSMGQGGFDAMFDFPLRYALIDTVCHGQDLRRLASVLSLDRVYPDPGGLVTFLDNHDLPRAITECGGDAALTDVLWTLLFSLRGTPSLTWGSELGLAGGPEPDNRKDMPWDQAERPNPLLKALIALRRAHPWMQDTKVHMVHARPQHLAWAARSGEELLWVELLRGEGAALGPPEGEVLEQQAVNASGLQVSLTVLRPTPSAWEQLELELVPVPLRFVVDLSSVPLGPGESLVLVGSAPELGAWDPSRGLSLDAKGEGTLLLPVAEVSAYKLVIVGPSGPRWEQRSDRYLVAATGSQRMELAWERAD